MKSPSLDTLNINLDKHILLTQSYTEIEGLSFIIRSCRLKTFDYLNDKDATLLLHRHWVDEYGNSLFIIGKNINIIYNDLSLDHNKIVCTDLYYGLSFDKIIKMSKMSYLCLGKDEDLFQECGIISFLGIDNYLRSYMYLYGEWQQISPLILGINNLQLIEQNKDINYFRNLSNEKNMPIPCFKSEQWLTCLPASESLISTIAKQYDIAPAIFNQTKD